LSILSTTKQQGLVSNQTNSSVLNRTSTSEMQRNFGPKENTQAENENPEIRNELNKAQIDGLKTCVGEKVKEATIKNQAQVAAYFTSTEECFQDPAVQGKCEKPERPTPSPSADVPPTTPTSVVRGTPSAETLSCLGGAKDAFTGCLKREVNVSTFPGEGEGRPQAPQQAGEHHMQHFSPQQMEAFLVKICKNDTEAIKAFKNCSMAKAEPYKQALMETFMPLALICRSKNECESENVNNKLSPECKGKVQKFVQATCTCKTEVTTYFNNTASCSSLRQLAEQHAHDHAQVADDHHDQFGNFCADPSKDVCEKFYEDSARYNHHQ